MHLSGTDLVVSATDVSGFLACRHLTTLEHAKAHGGPKPPEFPDPGVEVLRQRGEEHERNILRRYKAEGRHVVELTKPDWETGRAGGWSRYAAETREAMRSGADVIHQACLFDGEWLGLPDFLIRVDRPGSLGAWSYEVVDAKLSREAKVGAVLQICFYSEMLEAAQGTAPERMHLALGGPVGRNGASSAAPGGTALETFRVTDFAAYFRSVKRRFVDALTDRPETYPEPCTHCDVCAWSPECRKRWRADDHLSLVAGITRKHRAALEADGVATLERLAQRPLPPEARLDGVSDATYAKIRDQARIQLEGRREGRPKYELLVNPEVGTGLLALPEKDPGDLFFDIEGDPHAFGEGLEYLLGWVDAEGAFTGLWALDPDEERRQFEAFIDMVMERWDVHEEMHVYHYAAYEKTALKRLAARYGTREEEVDRLLRGKVLVDLYRVVRQGLRASVESYSIKRLEPLYGFERDVELRAASSALANFEAWLQMRGPAESDQDGGRAETDEAKALRDDIEGYNRDDCMSTMRLRDWLEGLRPELEATLQAEDLIDGPLPRPVAPDPDPSETAEEAADEVRALVDELTAGISEDPDERTPEEQAKWLLAQLLSWHRREDKSVWWDFFRMMELDDDERVADGKALGGLTYDRVVGTIKQSHVHRFRHPPQDHDIRPSETRRDAIDPATDKAPGLVVGVDAVEGWIDIKWGKRSDVAHPRSLVPKSIVGTSDHRKRLRELARDIIANGFDGAKNRAAVDLLLRRPPRADQPAGAPLRAAGEASLDAGRRLAPVLDHTALPIQGPPGSGKTYIGARMITELIRAGKRVGVTGPSHKVIGNLLEAVCKAADEEGLTFSGVQKTEPERGCKHPAIRCIDDPKSVEALIAGDPLVREGDGGAPEQGTTHEPEPPVDLAAGTVWLWARAGVQDTVDVLVVDEAGQLSLANALAASGAAESVILLGDPRQLDQPTKGAHPPGTGIAALEHLVGGDTLHEDRGLFLAETWRLHPDLCAFNSELYYEQLLTSRPALACQRVDGPEPFLGAGLRMLAVEHYGNTSESPEEVEAIVAVTKDLLGSGATWVDHKGRAHAVTAGDVLVVAPYNAQVGAIRAGLAAGGLGGPAGVAVGTVDKFQGQEAPVVIYSMAASSIEYAPRGMEFLFSPNRTNVATSRARCVVVVVASPALFGPDCKSVRQMRLANGVARLGELAIGS